MQPYGKEGLGKLQANLHAYKNQAPYRGQTLDLSTSLDIQYVDYAQIMPNKTILYNHQKNVVVLSIVKGSGYFSVDSLQGAKHANVSYVSVMGHHRINIIPLSVGKFILRLEDQCLDSNQGVPLLSEVSVVSDVDFSSEVSKPGRSLRYCRDVDESMFCLFLSIDRIVTTTRPTTFAPIHPPIPQTTAAPITQKPKAQQFHRTSEVTTPKPARVESIDVIKPTTTPSPKVNFEEKAVTAEGEQQKTSILHRIFAYLMVLVVTAAAVTLGYKWWQDQNKRRPMNVSFSTRESSFLRQSPGSGGAGSARFSPSTSVRGPTSSTPRARPLYSERFSTTLLTD
jgi:hypothetical protein